MFYTSTLLKYAVFRHATVVRQSLVLRKQRSGQFEEVLLSLDIVLCLDNSNVVSSATSYSHSTNSCVSKLIFSAFQRGAIVI